MNKAFCTVGSIKQRRRGSKTRTLSLPESFAPAALTCPHILFEALPTLAITISLLLHLVYLLHHLLLTAQTQSRELPTIREEDTASTADTATQTRRSSGLRSCAGGCPPAASCPGAGRGGCRCVSGGGRGGEGWGVLCRWSRGSAVPD